MSTMLYNLKEQGEGTIKESGLVLNWRIFADAELESARKEGWHDLFTILDAKKGVESKDKAKKAKTDEPSE